MLTIMVPETTVRVNPKPAAWSLYHALDTDTMRALHDAGVRIVGSAVLSRTCPECGQRGEVGVSERDYQDGIAFIAADGWTCRRCRERETAHWVASPKPTPASRGGHAASGKQPSLPGRRRSTQSTNASRKQRAVNAAWKLYYDAQETLEAIERGDIPASATTAAVKQRDAAWHTLARYGVVRGQEV